MTVAAHPHHDDLPAAIADLAGLIAAAHRATEEGTVVELDLVAMRIAVLCDAIGGLDAKVAQPLRPALDKVLAELNGLDFALRRRNVDLSLDLAQADRRLRAQVAYGAKPDDKKK